MVSRITVTQKGRSMQKDVNNESKGHLPALLSSNMFTSSSYKLFYSPNKNEKSGSQSGKDNFGSTVNSRSGYFGPKRTRQDSQENLTRCRPNYYPNYLRRSPEDYPNSHFTILTADHALRHLTKNDASQTVSMSKEDKADSNNISVLASKRKLPIKYVHHTIFPYTHPDKPSFVNSHIIERKQSPLNETHNYSNTSGSPMRVINMDGEEEGTQNMRVRRSRVGQRQDDLQKTLFLDHTIVTDQYSGKIVKKYDDRKLNKMKDRHLETQQLFANTLSSIEFRYQRKVAKHEENMNEAPEFLREMKEKENLMDKIRKMQSNEDERYRQRLLGLQNKKYHKHWNQLRSTTTIKSHDINISPPLLTKKSSVNLMHQTSTSIKFNASQDHHNHDTTQILNH